MSLESEELHRLARAIFDLGRASERVLPTDYSEIELVRIARALYDTGARLSALVPKRLFRDPIWDLLLDLYIQEAAGRRVSITSACLAARSSQSTALRCIGTLEELKLIFREPDVRDKRRAFLRLSTGGKRDIEAVLKSVETRLRQALSSGVNGP